MSIIFYRLPQQQNPRYQYYHSRNINKTSVACLYSLSLLITTLKCELSVMLITGDCLSAKIVSSNSLLMLQSQFFLNRFAFCGPCSFSYYAIMLPFDFLLTKTNLNTWSKCVGFFFLQEKILMAVTLGFVKKQ